MSQQISSSFRVITSRDNWRCIACGERFPCRSDSIWCGLKCQELSVDVLEGNVKRSVKSGLRLLQKDDSK